MFVAKVGITLLDGLESDIQRSTVAKQTTQRLKIYITRYSSDPVGKWMTSGTVNILKIKNVKFANLL